MGEKSNVTSNQKRDKRLKTVAGILAVALIFMFILFFLQWYLIRELFSFATDIVERQLAQQAPEGVEAVEIEKTSERVKPALLNMPMSYISGKINLKKVKAAGNYALKANEDDQWTSEEVNTLLKMMNAAVGFKREVD